MAVWREKEGDGRQLFGEYYFPDRSCPSAPHWAQGPETRSVRNRRGFLRAHWGGGSWALVDSPRSLLLCLGRPCCLRASFGGQLWSRTCPRIVPPISPHTTQMLLYIKSNQYDFRRAPLCNNWYPTLGSLTPPQVPARDARRARQGNPKVIPRNSWFPF